MTQRGKKYGTASRATHGNIVRRMRIVCSITKATGPHSEYLMLIAFPRQDSYANAPYFYLYTKINRLVYSRYNSYPHQVN